MTYIDREREAGAQAYRDMLTEVDRLTELADRLEQDAAGWRTTAKEYEGQVEALAHILAANAMREAADDFRREVAGDKRPSYVTTDVFQVWTWFRDRATALDTAPHVGGAA